VTRFAGYAALFDIADAAGDVIRPGAFAKALAETSEVPLYWQHRPERRIGAIERLEEDSRGLRVIAKLDPTVRPRDATGLSFGYRARGFRKLPAGRLLEDIDLLEVSLVTHPLQHLARVHLTLPQER
jgi:HK97 family phage prohead protease